MNGKNRTVYWQASISVDGKQWPLLIETQLPATPAKFKEAAENVARWLVSANIYPWLGHVPLTEAPPPASAPMPERDAVSPEIEPPVCPKCLKIMLKSKHQQDQEGTSFYCGQRTDNNNYCLWRGYVNLLTHEEKVYEIKSKS